MRVTRDETFRLIDGFTEFIEGMVGEDCIIHRGPDQFSVEILRRKKREPKPVLNKAIMDRVIAENKDFLKEMGER